MKKTKIFLTLSLSLILLFAVGDANVQSRTKVYYSGESIVYHNNLLFATVNTGALELFQLKNKQIVRTAMLKPEFVHLPKGLENFNDLQFVADSNKLYLYLSNGRYLYRYDVSDPYHPRLLDKIKDNAWDWFRQISKTDDYLVTIGSKEIKFWNQDLQVVKAYQLDYQKAENVFVSFDSQWIFTLIDNKIFVYSTAERTIKTQISFVAIDNNLRELYFDDNKKELYVVDDTALKVFDLNGQELRSFVHKGDHGYSVRSSVISNSVYFSDGLGIVRNDKNTLKALSWKYTTDIATHHDWAMGISVSADNTGDKIVVFNNNEILVLNNDLQMIDYWQATEIDLAPIEKLHLELDKKEAFPGDYVTIYGGGFAVNEELSIQMGQDKWTVMTDNNGRFQRTFTVVDIKPQITDIKVDGLQSKLTYSISFRVD